MHDSDIHTLASAMQLVHCSEILFVWSIGGDETGTLMEISTCTEIYRYKTKQVSSFHADSFDSLCSFCSPTIQSLISMYNLSELDAVDNASGPLLIEVDRLPGTDLGLSLSPVTYQSKSCLCVDTIQPMRNADRCVLWYMYTLVLC